MRWQRSLQRVVELTGVALHSGATAYVQLHPAPADTGIVFRVATRARDATATAAASYAPRCEHVRAHIAHVDDRKSQLCTQLTSTQATNGAASVSTVEHLMAALTAASITNIYVDVDAVPSAATPDSTSHRVELPILDGSSLGFVDAIHDAGIQELRGAVQRYIRVEKPVQVLLEDKAAWLLPMPNQLGTARVAAPTLELSVQVNFAHKGLGTSFCRFTLGGGDDPNTTLAAFRSEIAPARTFTFEDEVEWMRAHGLALGGSLDNAVVFRTHVNVAAEELAPAPQLLTPSERALNPRGLRFPVDEWARHKLLDCIGDVGLAGLPLHGHFFATSPGHALTHKLLRALFSDAANYSEVAMDE